jgi:hypothetical protein
MSLPPVTPRLLEAGGEASGPPLLPTPVSDVTDTDMSWSSSDADLVPSQFIFILCCGTMIDVKDSSPNTSKPRFESPQQLFVHSVGSAAQHEKEARASISKDDKEGPASISKEKKEGRPSISEDERKESVNAENEAVFVFQE